MAITLSTVINVVLFSGITILLLYYISVKSDIINKIGISTILFLVFVLLIRLFFPIELPFQITINITKVWPNIFIFLKTIIFTFKGIEWTLLSLLLLISMVGSVIGIIKLFISYIILKLSIKSEIEQINYFVINKVFEQVNVGRRKSIQIKIVSNKSITSPFIFGLFKPYIVLPNIMLLEEEWYYVLLHEISHYDYKDLWVRFIGELLHIIYWWNPFIYLLRKQIVKFQELRVDTNVMNKLTELQKLDYIKCIIKITNLQCSAQKESFVVGFNNGYEVLERINFLFDYAKGYNIKKGHFKSTIIKWILVISIFLMPNFIIFEPSSIPKKHVEGTFEVNKKNAYYIKKKNGTYDVYINEEYIVNVTEIFDDDLKIISEE